MTCVTIPVKDGSIEINHTICGPKTNTATTTVFGVRPSTSTATTTLFGAPVHPTELGSTLTMRSTIQSASVLAATVSATLSSVSESVTFTTTTLSASVSVSSTSITTYYTISETLGTSGSWGAGLLGQHGLKSRGQMNWVSLNRNREVVLEQTRSD